MGSPRLGLGNTTNLFFCPIEGGDRTFELVEMGKIGAMLAKIDPERFSTESIIRCEGCDTPFDSAVLDVVTNDEMVRRIDLAARSLFGSLIRATPDDEEIVQGALDAMIPYVIRPGSAADLIDVGSLVDHRDPLLDVVEVLDPTARMAMMEAAIGVSVTSGRIRARHLGILVHAGEALDVSQRWIRSRIVERRRTG